MQTVIITGPTGMIGIALMNSFLSKGIKVYAVIRPNSKRRHLIPNNPLVTVIECDLAQLAQLNISDLKGVDAFYHLGWEGTSHEARQDVFIQNANISYTLEAVKLADKLHCQTFIFAGSQAEYGRVNGKLTPQTPVFPENGYGISKLCAGLISRQLCNKLNIRHCWVRILSIYGKYDGEQTMISSTIHCLENNQPTAFTPSEQLWDYLYSKDAAKALYLIGEKGKNNHIYCIGSGIAKPLRYYIETMRNIINPEAELGFGVKPYSAQQVMYLCADITNLTHDTGFIPDYTFEEGIEDMIQNS